MYTLLTGKTDEKTSSYKGKFKRIILTGWLWLPYFETNVAITFEVEDNFDYEVIEINSDYLGILTSEEDIEDGFFWFVEMQIELQKEYQ